MSREADSAFPEVKDVFDPPLYTDDDLVFILDHLGETSYLALQNAADDGDSAALRMAEHEDAAALSRGVTLKGGKVRQDRPSAVKSFQASVGNALQRFHELNELAKHRQTEWMVFDPKENVQRPGFEGIKLHIERWLKRNELVRQRKAADPQGKGFAPEMFSIPKGGGEPEWAKRGTSCERVRYPLVLVDQGTRSYADVSEAYEMGSEDRDVTGNGDDPVEEPVSLETVRGDRSFSCPVDGCEYTAEFDPESEMDVNRAERGFKVHLSKPKGKFKPNEHLDAKERLFG